MWWNSQYSHMAYMAYNYAVLPALQWRHNGHDGVSNHQPQDCLPNRLFRHRLKKASKVRVTGLCEGNSPVTGEFPAQRASNAENVSIWWRHHVDAAGRFIAHGDIMISLYLVLYIVVAWVWFSRFGDIRNGIHKRCFCDDSIEWFADSLLAIFRPVVFSS